MRFEIPLEDDPLLAPRLSALAEFDPHLKIDEGRLLAESVDASFLEHRRPRIGMIGTRRPTSYGLRFVRESIEAFASFGWTLVSGGALGIDAEVHRSALEFGLPTWSFVVGSPKDPGPVANRALFRAIRDRRGSALLTSSTLSQVTHQKFDWIRRNAWMVGLCDVLIVVEGLRPSGTWSSAEFAREYKIPVLALPGPVFSPQSEATNLMISGDLAKIILSVEDLVQTLIVRFGSDSYNKGTGPFRPPGGVPNAQVQRLSRYPEVETNILEFLGEQTQDSIGIDIWKLLAQGQSRGFSSSSLLEALEVLQAAGKVQIAGRRLERRGSL